MANMLVNDESLDQVSAIVALTRPKHAPSHPKQNPLQRI